MEDCIHLSLVVSVQIVFYKPHRGQSEYIMRSAVAPEWGDGQEAPWGFIPPLPAGVQ